MLMGRILITGGAGFIGHNTALMALEMGHEVHILDNLSTGLQDNADVVLKNGGEFDFADIKRMEDVNIFLRSLDLIRENRSLVWK